MVSGENRFAYCDLLVTKADEHRDTIEQVCIGLTWTVCKTSRSTGFAMSPGESCRTLPWPGTLVGRRASSLAPWIKSWNAFEAAAGLAAANALINAPGNAVMEKASDLPSGNLAVFEHFKPRLAGSKVAVVGRYPGLETVLGAADVIVLERNPQTGDFPDAAAEYVLPTCDWVFLTASSLINKTFPRLAELSQGAVTVLMGPSMPWLAEWRDFGIDILAGVRISNREKAWQVAIEGGGIRLFDEGVRYAIVDLRALS